MSRAEERWLLTPLSLKQDHFSNQYPNEMLRITIPVRYQAELS